MAEECLFCNPSDETEHTLVAESDLCYARLDNFPVSRGHLQVVPKRHVISLFDCTDAEVTDMYGLLKKSRDIVDEQYSPDGYNVGVNDGEAAGRTVHHLHIHLIPRYLGDTKHPRGGIRHVIPSKGTY